MKPRLAGLACAALLALFSMPLRSPAVGTSDAPAPAAARRERALAQALSAAQQGDFASAAKALEPAMPALAANARAWRLLGLVRLKLNRSALAIEAYRKSLVLEPDSAQAMYYLGVAEAQLGDAEAAFAWLQKARASRRYDMTQIQVEKDLEPLRVDARFAALLPTARDFEHPFVEDVHVIREWDGEAAGDQFGWIARVIGDVDGDGFNDFVTSAPTKNIGGPGGDNAGRVYVYSGRSGALLWSADGAPGDQLGTAASRPRATPTATACPTSSPARPRSTRPPCTRGATDECCSGCTAKPRATTSVSTWPRPATSTATAAPT